jgi:hypothetical protein
MGRGRALVTRVRNALGGEVKGFFGLAFRFASPVASPSRSKGRERPGSRSMTRRAHTYPTAISCDLVVRRLQTLRFTTRGECDYLSARNKYTSTPDPVQIPLLFYFVSDFVWTSSVFSFFFSSVIFRIMQWKQNLCYRNIKYPFSTSQRIHQRLNLFFLLHIFFACSVFISIRLEF